MCHFHSISVSRKGEIAHVSKNSHSEAVEAAEWPENTNTRTSHYCCEWDGEGEYPGALAVIDARAYAEPPSKTVLDAIDNHYGHLARMIGGDVGELEYFCGKDYLDVRRGVAQNPNTSAAVLERMAGDEDGDVR